MTIDAVSAGDPKTAVEIPPAPALLFDNLQRQNGFEPALVEGTLPPGLKGTLYRNGVGILEQFGCALG